MSNTCAYLLALLTPILLMLAGWAVLWGRAYAYRRSRSTGEVLLPQLFTVAGWGLLVSGFCGAIVATTLAFAVVFVPVGIVILVTAVRRYRDAERQALLWCLMTAAERQIPLESAAHAFAEERSDLLGTQARNLADYLEAGVPLGLSLQRAGCRVATSALLAADLGEQAGMLGAALRQTLRQDDHLEATLQKALEKLFYLLFLAVFVTGVLTFFMIKIWPVFNKMFDDFGLKLPAVSQSLVGLLTKAGPVGALVGLVLLGALLASGLWVYLRLTPRDAPVASRLWRTADGALALRWLSLAVQRQRPIAEMVRLLAGYFPRTGMRSRLERAAIRIEQGGSWCDSLRRAGVIGRAECGLFQSAERTGHLVWALDEMAQGRMRRMAYRLHACVHILFPAVVVGFGTCVLAVAVGLLLPLFSLIQGLS